MNINECGCRPYGWPRPWWWSVYPRDTPTPPSMDRMTDACESIAFPQLLLQMVKIRGADCCSLFGNFCGLCDVNRRNWRMLKVDVCFGFVLCSAFNWWFILIIHHLQRRAQTRNPCLGPGESTSIHWQVPINCGYYDQRCLAPRRRDWYGRGVGGGIVRRALGFMVTRETKKTHDIMITAWPPCLPPRGQQVSHQSWICWGTHYIQVMKHASKQGL